MIEYFYINIIHTCRFAEQKKNRVSRQSSPENLTYRCSILRNWAKMSSKSCSNRSGPSPLSRTALVVRDTTWYRWPWQRSLQNRANWNERNLQRSFPLITVSSKSNFMIWSPQSRNTHLIISSLSGIFPNKTRHRTRITIWRSESNRRSKPAVSSNFKSSESSIEGESLWVKMRSLFALGILPFFLKASRQSLDTSSYKCRWSSVMRVSCSCSFCCCRLSFTCRGKQSSERHVVVNRWFLWRMIDDGDT